jgi:hypothetical protein
VLTNPFVSSRSYFFDDFWIGIDSDFLDYFWVNKGCVHWWIHASALESISVMISKYIVTQFSYVRSRIHVSSQEIVSVMISESIAIQFSLNICEWTGVVSTEESIHQLWKKFRWWFMSRQRLSFPWLFLSQNGLCAVTNPCVITRNSFGDDFWVDNDLVFLDYLWVNKGCFGDDFWVRSDSVFLDYLWVNKGCMGWRIQASTLQAVSVMIFESTATQFSLNIF